MYFYAIEPAPALGSGSSTSFEPGSYPLVEVLETIRRLDPSTDEYRLKDDLFGGETFCLLHEDGAQPIMGAYYRDNLSKPLTEYKGEISELLLRDGEAVVDAAYAAFFPGDILGLVRTSSKAPGFAKIGNWLSLAGGHNCGLFALRDANTIAQLDAHPTGLRRLSLRIRTGRVEAVGAHSEDVASALRAAAAINPASREVGIRLDSGRKEENQARWSELARQEIEELLGVLPDFEEAKVTIAGLKNPVNLLRANIQRSLEISIVGSKRVGPAEAADALFRAYDQEQEPIRLALEARRERR